jgi:hypothetical protein
MILSGLQETPRTPVGELKQSSRNSCIPRAGRPPEGDNWSEVDRVSVRMNAGGDPVPSARRAETVGGPAFAANPIHSGQQ